MKLDARKDNGGARPGAGRRFDPVPTERVEVRLTKLQREKFKLLDGGAWLQGVLNLLIADRPDALVLLLLTELEKNHGREWLSELAAKINERVAR